MAPVEIKLGSESIVANLESASDHSRMPHKHCRKLSDSFKCVYKCSILRSSVPMCEVSPATLPRGALRCSQRPLIFDRISGRRARWRAESLHFSRCVQIALVAASHRIACKIFCLRSSRLRFASFSEKGARRSSTSYVMDGAL